MESLNNEPEQKPSEPKFRKLTRREILLTFYNTHHRNKVAHEINQALFESLPDKTTIAQIPTTIPGTNERVLRQVDAKAGRQEERQRAEQEQSLLEAIDRLLQREGE